MKKHWPTILLYIAGLFYTFATLSNRFDGDFGWQLRFGKDWLASGFPYLDTYTFSYYGRLWINHEWGGSLLWWSIYQFIGYNALVLFVAIIVWTTFVVIPKVFRYAISPLSVVCSLFAIAAANDVLYTRLTVIAPAFFLLLLYTLERIPEKKYYYFWPLLMWVWGALHGSWILAFIVIGIYVGAKLLEHVLRRIFPIAYRFVTPAWNTKTYYRVFLSIAASAVVLCINPYGMGIWREVLTYFSQSYYTRYITEWQAAYVYPILIWPLIIGAVVVTLSAYGFWQRKLTLSQLLLCVALQYAAFSHKRNIIYAMLISIPVLYGVLRGMSSALHVNARLKSTLTALSPAVLVFITSLIVAPTLHMARWHTNVWHETAFLEAQGFPANATIALQKLSEDKQLILFDQFRWGGFLNWQVPTVPVYIDGRGTVSWQLGATTTLYQDYRTLLYEDGGLQFLESKGVNAVLLEQPNRQFFATNAANALLFSSTYLAKVTTPETSALEKSLNTSPHWKKVYSDSLANIWVRL